MPGFRVIDPRVKAEVMTKVRDEGMSVSEAANTYGVSVKTIYGWLRSGVVDGSKNNLAREE